MSRTPEFTARLAPLRQAREASETARRDAYTQAQRHQKLGRASAQAGRGKDRDDIAAIEAETEAARAAAGRAWSAFDARHLAEREVLEGLAPLLDPREQAQQFDDGFPVLMMPLRLETRFAPSADELWIRVYPDSWAVDAFEDRLSETEIANVRVFWTGYWAAAGRRTQEVAAWRTLVAAHGAGRAAWLCTAYRPFNEADMPAAGGSGDRVLVLEGARPAEADAIASYWIAVWQAPGNSNAQAQAQATLRAAIGDAAADAALAAPPRNLVDAADPPDPAARAAFIVRAVWIEWQGLDDSEIKAVGWSEPARTDMLPERLVVTLIRGDANRSEIGNVIPSTVKLGFDPSAPDAEQITQANGELTLPDGLAWIFDFDKAVEIGLGFRIPLSAAERQAGFNRILVCGLSLRDDETEARDMLERWIDHQRFSDTGLSLLPQGTPTNNSDRPSGYSERDDVGEAFDRMFGDAPDLARSGRLEKPDGQWLAEWLGIDAAHVARLPNADGRDQLEARAMNRLLWPATLGYSLDTLMTDLLGKAAVADTRHFFEDYVLARDCIPQIRVGDQPYGILPASAWSKHRWFLPREVDGRDAAGGQSHREAMAFLDSSFGATGFFARLNGILRQAHAQWTDLVPGTAHVGRAGDLHQTLLDILGLAPNSLEFYRRNADSHEHFFNLLRAQGLGGLIQILLTSAKTEAGKELLRAFGWKGQETPEILKFVFHGGQEPLRHILVDDVEPSETLPVRVYTEADRNYLHWLVAAGETSLEALRRQEGFLEDDVPTALLYHLARHALQLSYWDVGMRMHRNLADPILSAEEIAEARREPALVHIAPDAARSSSRYLHLYRPAEAITGDAQLSLQAHIGQVWAQSADAADHRRVLDALRRLADTPTARLERLLIEHLDLCSYRLDAWKQGVLHLQLDFMRHHRGGARGPAGSVPAAATSRHASGVYLGAYGWLEDVRPRQTQPQPAQVPADMRAAFDADVRPLVEDPSNLGYIHAPSLDQAQTAAVLRSTYLANADPQHPETMAINLSSWRVRAAMTVLEGLRNDQSLGELLGYRFERELHENFQLAETDAFVFALRAHFPLVANKIRTTYRDLEPGESIETIEARNVVDGEALIDHIAETGEKTYPFGLPDMPSATGPQADKINAAADRLRNVADAVADLAMAESVHQAMKGKPEASAAALDAHGSGLFPPVSEFVATPREGITLTSRTAIFLDPAPPVGPAWPAMADTRRAQAEPVLDQWLATVFPAADEIGFEVHNATTGVRIGMTLADLGGQPIDWFCDLNLVAEETTTALIQRIKDHYQRTHAPVHPRDRIAVDLRSAGGAQVSLFETAALVAAARDLVTRGRPLEASDIALSNDSREQRSGGDPVLPRARADAAIAALGALEADALAFAAALDAELADPEANAAALRTGLSGRFAAFAGLVAQAREFGFSELDPAIAMRWRRGWFRALETALDDTIANWRKRLADFHGYIAQADAAPPGAPFSAVFRPLQRAERQISTTVTTPMPADRATFRADLAARVTAFEDRLTAMVDLRATLVDDADAFLSALEALLPLTAFVPEDFDISEAHAAFARPSAEMAQAAAALALAIAKRRKAAQSHLAAHDAASDARARVEAVSAALRALFGADFIALPHFTFGAAQQAELTLCHGDRAALVRHQRDDLGDPDPLDTWLNGVARVRDRMATLETFTVLREAMTGGDSALDAWQLPHVPDDHWLGAAYPAGHVIDGDRLLVQAHHAVAFAPAAPQCGLLLDEWTEVIPTEEITTGVAFHFDQPGSEPPQTFLLLTPTDFRGGWTWDDIIDGLNETLDGARQRAVEPEQIDATAYALFLPATLASTAHLPITIALNYAVMNGYARTLAEELT